MRKALAGRRAMYRALKHRGYKKTKVTGLSDPIKQFQNDSTQLSLGKEVLSTKR